MESSAGSFEDAPLTSSDYAVGEVIGRAGFGSRLKAVDHPELFICRHFGVVLPSGPTYHGPCRVSRTDVLEPLELVIQTAIVLSSTGRGALTMTGGEGSTTTCLTTGGCTTTGGPMWTNRCRHGLPMTTCRWTGG